ncbi:unnamed protein product [Schistosoma margrebowiei]|uniref:Uncharacterized protein n=1 Tax=Schistosoma margrebowiei TaxID=48269 RepID=A0A183N028_9TREM|nr:unnamed protein product [Schistosoma margrebowiei]
MTIIFRCLLLLKLLQLLYVENLNVYALHHSHYIITSFAARTDQSCLKLIRLLVNIIFYRTKSYFAKNKSFQIDYIDNWMITLKNITIWGFDGLSQINQYDDQFSIEQEEIWLQSNKNQPNSDVLIKEWIMKRDEKLCDVYKIKFSIELNKNMEMLANWRLFPKWNYLTSENNFMHVKFIGLRFNVSLHLFINQNGAISMKFDHLKITQLSNIQLHTFQDPIYITSKMNSSQNDVVNSFENFTLSWLLDEKSLREILFYYLETSVIDILNKNLNHLQNNFTLNEGLSCNV